MQRSPERTAGPSSTGDHFTWYLETWALTVQKALLRLCPFYHCIDRWETKETKRKKSEGEDTGTLRKWDLGRAFWVVGSLIVLAKLWYWNPSQRWAMILVGVVAGVRLFEILVTSLGTALGQQSQVRARNLITIAIYGVQLILIFAILYHSFDRAGFEATEPNEVLGATDYLFISWSAFTSLGTEAFTPVNEGARYLQVATTSAGILLLGVLLAFGISEVQASNERSS
jgi:hypothetical protein